MLLCKQIQPERGGIVYGVLVFDQFVGVVPAVEFAEFCTGFFELVGGFFFLHGVEVRAAYLVLKEPFFCKGAVLDVGKDFLHGFLGVFCYDLGGS